MSPASAVATPSAVAAPPSTIPTIQVERLTKDFGSERAVDDIGFTVGQGEIMGFLGPNGAGKTTTMRILAGYTPATSGRAVIAGHDVATDAFRARAHLGYLPENAPLYPSMRVIEQLRFMAEIKRCPRVARKSLVRRAIEECGLEEVAHRIIGNLSKGFRQRVALAQTIVGDPPVLILDEPTVGLDPRQIIEVRRMIKDMAGKRTVLLSTHILPEVTEICQKVLVIDRGRIVASGTPEKLVSTLKAETPIHVTVEGDPDQVEKLLNEIDAVSRVERHRKLGPRRCVFHVFPKKNHDPRNAIAGLIVATPEFELRELTAPGGTLEDVFLQVISSTEGS